MNGPAWMEPGPIRHDIDATRVMIPVPAKFSEMQQQNIEIALAWRLALREAFTTAFDRGYRAVDFFLNRDQGSGAYLLARDK